MNLDILNNIDLDIDTVNTNTESDFINTTNKKTEFNNTTKGLKFSPILTDLTKRIDSVYKEIKSIKTDMNKLEAAYNHDIKKISKHKDKIVKKRKETGFMRKKKVPKKIQDYLDEGELDKLSRNEVSKKIHDKIKSLGLVYDKDRRVLRADDDLKKLFNLPDNINESTDPKDKENGFNLYNLQSHIAKIYKEDEIIKVNKSTKKKKKRKNKKNI